MVQAGELSAAQSDDSQNNREVSATDRVTEQEEDVSVRRVFDIKDEEKEAVDSTLHSLSLDADLSGLMSQLEEKVMPGSSPPGMTLDAHRVNILKSIATKLRCQTEDSRKWLEQQKSEQEQLQCKKTESEKGLKAQDIHVEELHQLKKEVERKWKAEKQKKSVLEEEDAELSKQLRQAKARSEREMNRQAACKEKLRGIEKRLKRAELMHLIMGDREDPELRKAVEDFYNMAKEEHDANLLCRSCETSKVSLKANRFGKPNNKRVALSSSDSDEEASDTKADKLLRRPKSVSPVPSQKPRVVFPHSAISLNEWSNAKPRAGKPNFEFSCPKGSLSTATRLPDSNLVSTDEEPSDNEQRPNSSRQQIQVHPTTLKRVSKPLNPAHSSGSESESQPAKKRSRFTDDQRKRSTRSIFSTYSTAKASPASDPTRPDQDIKSEGEDRSTGKAEPCTKHVDGNSCLCEDCYHRLRDWNRKGTQVKRRKVRV
ncbi:hypothetical protein H2198_003743 [Neophaeococcomyces mojaviensis]|uniref:Uncharacterized protein n=1 Tax=Neophaeococcomyces mojaviensis TaxID=3383035 RepID=A0ACC3AAC7_9EURO|nr:hypothetical protein H2198_003743 [Knufia sp. JES_112]